MYANVIFGVTLFCLIEVNSNDLILGSISPKSRLLLSDVQQALMAPWVRTRHITVHGHADEVISAIRVYDLKKKKDGVVRLDGGEIGAPKVVLGLRSGGPFKSYAFKIEIYVERSQSLTDIDNNTVLIDFVKNITKTMLREALGEIMHENAAEEEEAEPSTTTQKPVNVNRKRKRKKGKHNQPRSRTPQIKLSRLPAETKSMMGTESKLKDGSPAIPPLSGVYSRWTRLSLPAVRISMNVLKNSTTPHPASSELTFENLL